MTDANTYPDAAGEPVVMPASPKPPYLSLAGILGAVGGVCLVVINRWAEIEPILESPAMVVLAMLSNFFAGCGAFYWVVSRPADERFRRAEDLIRRMRDRENMMMSRIAELEVAKARLEERLSAIEARVAETTTRPPGKPRNPKPKA